MSRNLRKLWDLLNVEKVLAPSRPAFNAPHSGFQRLLPLSLEIFQ